MIHLQSIRRVSVAALLMGSVFFALSVSTTMAAEPGSGKTIRVGRPTWNTSWFFTAIYIQMLEKLGYTVNKPVTLDAPVLFQSIGQGDLDFQAEADIPLHNAFIDKVKSEVSLVGHVIKGGRVEAYQGYLIDKKTADKYHITNLDDFKKPGIAKLFDSNGDGKANLVACPPGWGCELEIKHQLDAYKLRDYVEPIKASYEASMADALARYQQGKSIFFYTWRPNWTLYFLKPGKDVVWLEVPFVSLRPTEKGFEKYAVVPNVTGCVENHNPCKLGWVANDIRIVANNDFLAENPAAKKLFEETRIPMEDILAQNAEMHEGKGSEKDISAAAAKWIQDHQSEVDDWLNAARKAAM